MLPLVSLLIPLSIAVVTDVHSHTIYNWTVYPGILLAFGVSLFATLTGQDFVQGTGADLLWLGTPDIWAALAGFVCCGMVMLVCYVFFPGGVGGGDVKLIAMMGAFLGTGKGFEAMLWTFVFGGCLALVTLVWQEGAGRMAGQLLRRTKAVLLARSWLPLTDQEREPLQVRLFLTPAAFIAVIVVQEPLINRFLLEIT